MVGGLELAGGLFLLTGVINVAFLWIAVGNWGTPGSASFALMIVGSLVWSVSVSVAAFVPDRGVTLVMFKLQLSGAQLAVAGWFLLALEIIDRNYISRRVIGGFAAYIAVFQFLVWSNPLHWMMWVPAAIDVSSGFVDLDDAARGGYWVFIVSSYAFLLTALALLVREVGRSIGPQRKQAGAFALSTVPVMVASAATILDYPFGSFDVTPFGYVLAFAGITWAMYRGRFLDIVPVARHTVVEEMDDIVVTLDGDSRVVDFNTAAQRALNIGEDDIGRSAVEVFEGYADTASTYAEKTSMETEITIEDGGNTRHFDLTISPLGRGSATERGRVVVLREITRLKEREAQIRQREEELDLLRQVLSRMLRHNLRNDLQVISGSAETITRVDDERVPQLVDNILKATDQLMKTGEKAQRIERVLDADAEPRPMEIGDLTAEVLEELRTRYPDASIDAGVPEQAPAVVHRDFRMAIEDLVENGIVHASASNPTVEVDLWRENGAVYVQVVDEGPGIPADELAVLEQKRETELKHGSGGGLWVVDLIVEKSNGSLSFDVSSTGSTVTIQVPAAQQAAGDGDEP